MAEEVLIEWLARNPRVDGVHRLSDTKAYEEQQRLYMAVRRSEGRVYDDDVVARLPAIERGHPQEEEWGMRTTSLSRLVNYLGNRVGQSTILDVGCGNGWMSASMARVLDCAVVGLDVNLDELLQAARVFSDQDRLAFAFGDILRDPIPEGAFSAIVLAAAVQYFEDLPGLLRTLRALLADGGEIHILDSPFYDHDSVQGARERSATYYRDLGYPEMATYYHHQTLDELGAFNPHCMFDPRSLAGRIKRRVPSTAETPFPWFVIEKD
jgi:SAM-dependent methyltransferase